MNLKEIQNLIKFISKTNVEEVKLEFEDVKLTVTKGSSAKSQEQVFTTLPQTTVAPVSSPTTSLTEVPVQSSVQEPRPAPKIQADNNIKEILSPMIGTLYLSPKPGEPAFVSVGDKVKKGDTLCTIEAMKLFNHISSEHNGKIVEILVENESPVEFNQPLFRLELS